MTDMELNEAEEFEQDSPIDRLIKKYDMACKDLSIIKSLCNITMDDRLKIRSIKMILEQREND
jgi:hypothetical protein